MFSDLKKGFQIHALDTNGIPKYSVGKIVDRSEPRFLNQPGTSYPLQDRVIDLTVNIDGETKTYTVPEGQNVAKALGITLSIAIDPILNELNAIKSNSQEILDSREFHEERIEACDKIFETVNPVIKQTREQDKRISGIENKVERLNDSFDELKKLIVERLNK